MLTYRQRLIARIDEIAGAISQVLDEVEIRFVPEKRVSGRRGKVVAFVPQFDTPAHHRYHVQDQVLGRLMQVREEYVRWNQQFRLLFRNPTEALAARLRAGDDAIRNWLDLNDRSGPPTLAQAHAKLANDIDVLRTLLEIPGKSDTSPVVIPDTNALTWQLDQGFEKYAALAGVPACTVLLVPPVLVELDELKVRSGSPDYREKVQSVVNAIQKLADEGASKGTPLLRGIAVGRNNVVRSMAREPKVQDVLSWLDPQNRDDRIIACALEAQSEFADSTVILVTRDVNLMNKAELAELPYFRPPAEASPPAKRPELKLRPLCRLEYGGNQYSGDTPVFIANVILGIHNGGTKIAHYPAMSVKPAPGFHVHTYGIDGNGNHGLPMRPSAPGRPDRGIEFVGGADQPIHPGKDLDVVRLSGRYPVTTSALPDAEFECEVWCDGFAAESSTITISATDILGLPQRSY